MAEILVPMSPGELFDKITILEIKVERISDEEQRRNVRTELECLLLIRDNSAPRLEALDQLAIKLKDANLRLWELEDQIRACERVQDFGPQFIEYARAIYRENDDRAAIKRQVNQLLRSRIVEEKSYARY